MENTYFKCDFFFFCQNKEKRKWKLYVYLQSSDLNVNTFFTLRQSEFKNKLQRTNTSKTTSNEVITVSFDENIWLICQTTSSFRFLIFFWLIVWIAHLLPDTRGPAPVVVLYCSIYIACIAKTQKTSLAKFGRGPELGPLWPHVLIVCCVWTTCQNPSFTRIMIKTSAWTLISHIKGLFCVCVKSVDHVCVSFYQLVNARDFALQKLF